jgi:hypothetical protein
MGTMMILVPLAHKLLWAAITRNPVSALGAVVTAIHGVIGLVEKSKKKPSKAEMDQAYTSLSRALNKVNDLSR